MRKQSISKLILILKSLENRAIENAMYFNNIKVVYKSGSKNFIANITIFKDKFNINFNGVVKNIEINQFANEIASISNLYDEVYIQYEERGETIIVEANDKGVKIKNCNKKQLDDKSASYHEETSKINNREYFVKVNQANFLLKEIGILSENGKIKNTKIRKYNQIDYFIELVNDIIIKILDTKRQVTVLDCGCGKSYLSFVLNYYIKEVLKKHCYFIGVDVSENVILASEEIANNLSYKNMEFINTDIKTYIPQRNIDLVISLHACDTATDEAIAFAINHNIPNIVLVPCCHKEMLSQYDYLPFRDILKHGILKARLADVLTEGLRTLYLESIGYKVSIVEYISPLETPKNLMIKAEKLGNRNEKLWEKYNGLKRALNVCPKLEYLINNIERM